MHISSSQLQNTYDTFWQKAVTAFHAGAIQYDRHLAGRQNDRRRGLSLIIRPDKHVAARIVHFLRNIQELEPEQYYYQPQELHLTLLSLFTATEHYEPHVPNIPVYVSIFRSFFTTIRSFQIHLRGITASKGAVMLQGFPENDAINLIRDQLRCELTKHGLGDTLDTRYRITTAHSTVIRFYTPLRDSSSLLRELSRFREYDFGRFSCSAVQLVKNDWYMSTDAVEVLEEYILTD